MKLVFLMYVLLTFKLLNMKNYAYPFGKQGIYSVSAKPKRPRLKFILVTRIKIA